MTPSASPQSPRRASSGRPTRPGSPTTPTNRDPCSSYQRTFVTGLRDNVIVVPAFSAGRSGPTRVPVPASSGGLPFNSLLFCEEVTTIDKDFLRRVPGASVEPGTVAAVVRAIRRAIGEVVPS